MSGAAVRSLGGDLARERTSTEYSDASSIASSGDRIMATDSEGEEMRGNGSVDSHKYRIPGHVDASHKALPNLPTERGMSSRNGSVAQSTSSMSTMAGESPCPTPSISNADSTPSGDVQSYFNPLGLHRAESVYTLSRVSFEVQISQLTSLQLPQASSLKSSISSIKTSTAAAKALGHASDQIRGWIRKASKVIEGLDSQDEVDWAATGGRDGLTQIDGAITKFESLIEVYVGAIEELQTREDIGSLPQKELKGVAAQMEATVKEWKDARGALKTVKHQVEYAMEWEELWNTVLGDIENEITALSGDVFEMEEKRHSTITEESHQGNGVDLGDLSTILEETAPGGPRTPAGNSPSLPELHAFSSPLQSPGNDISQDDTYLGIFARMQPLRASLDFLPIRLSSFRKAASSDFPTACSELQRRTERIEADWARLQSDAENLRKELAEDRWVSVFRNAAKQAQKMCESLRRALLKVREAVDAGYHHSNPPSLAKRIEAYESQKMHCGPAITRVIGIIGNGVKDRRTINGDILRLQTETTETWASLEHDMAELDALLEDIHVSKSQQLRDSISSSISIDRSAAGSAIDTPGSSPASSVILSSTTGGKSPGTPSRPMKDRTSSGSFSSIPRPNAVQRHVSMPPGTSNPSQRRPASRLSSTPVPRLTARRSSPTGSTFSSTPTPSGPRSRPSMSNLDGRPRWNSSVNTIDSDLGHRLKHPSASSESPYKRPFSRSSQRSSLALNESFIPQPSPLGSDGSFSPSALTSSLAKLSVQDRRGSPARSTVSSTDAPRPSLRNRPSTSRLSQSTTRRRSSFVLDKDDAGVDSAALTTPTATPRAPRPATAMASGRRSSLLPQPRFTGRPSLSGTPKDRPGSSMARQAACLAASGRSSPSSARRPTNQENKRPAWR
ncbi:MAG: hypothetical protein M1833_006823 [Piccolia ochrophora]|nr:MAG: hypothetical protein M1833_006823 [Piccolia ochrophora]